MSTCDAHNYINLNTFGVKRVLLIWLVYGNHCNCRLHSRNELQKHCWIQWEQYQSCPVRCLDGSDHTFYLLCVPRFCLGPQLIYAFNSCYWNYPPPSNTVYDTVTDRLIVKLFGVNGNYNRLSSLDPFPGRLCFTAIFVYRSLIAFCV